VLQRLIKVDKHFLDPYLYLAQIEYDEENYEEYSRLVWEAYLKVIDLVANADGDYPKSFMARFLLISSMFCISIL